MLTPIIRETGLQRHTLKERTRPPVLFCGALNGILCLLPFVTAGGSAKLVGRSTAAQRVPLGHSKLQPVLHLLTHHHALWLIIVESHHVLALASLKGNLACKSEILFHTFSDFRIYFIT